MPTKRSKRSNPNPIPKFRVGDFLTVRAHDSRTKEHWYTVCVHPRKVGMIMMAGPKACFSPGQKLGIGSTCEWDIEVIGRENEIPKEG
jgi:hypothetical protein